MVTARPREIVEVMLRLSEQTCLREYAETFRVIGYRRPQPEPLK